MRNFRTRLLAVCGLLMGFFAAAQGQPLPSPTGGATEKKKETTDKAPAKSSVDNLDEILNSVLKIHPDIKLAEAQIHEAEARLNQARHQVLSKVISLQGEIRSAEKLVTHVKGLLDIAQLAFQKGSGSKVDVVAAEANFAKYEADVLRLKAELDAMLGKGKAAALDNLDEILDTVLKTHPDIKLGEVKIREAEARLNQVRHQVRGKVISLQGEIRSAEKLVTHVKGLQEIAVLAYQRGAGSQQDVVAAEANLARYEADVLRLKAELDAMLGKGKAGALLRSGDALGSTPASVPFHVGELFRAVETTVIADYPFPTRITYNGVAYGLLQQNIQAPMADRIREALNKTVKLDESPKELPLKDALNTLRDKAGIDIPFRLLLGSKQTETLSLMKAELPVGAWLQAFEDSVDVLFLVREYGILVTTRDRVPQGAVRVTDFWRQKTETPKAEPKKTEKGPPSGR